MEFTVHYGAEFAGSPSRRTSAPKLENKEAMKLLEEHFPDAVRKKTLHSYYTCAGSCSELSQSEQERQKGRGDVAV